SEEYFRRYGTTTVCGYPSVSVAWAPTSITSSDPVSHPFQLGGPRSTPRRPRTSPAVRPCPGSARSASAPRRPPAGRSRCTPRAGTQRAQPPRGRASQQHRLVIGGHIEIAGLADVADRDERDRQDRGE